MKNSALLSLKAYASDETNSSDNEETEQRDKIDAVYDSQAKIKGNAEADSSSVITPKKLIEASVSTDSEVSGGEEENSVTSSFSYSLISYLKEPAEGSHLLDYELKQVDSLNSSAKMKKKKKKSYKNIETNLKEPIEKSRPLEYDLKQIDSVNSPAKVKKKKKKSDKNLKCNLKDSIEKSQPCNLKQIDSVNSPTKVKKVKKKLDGNLESSLEEPTEKSQPSECDLKLVDALNSPSKVKKKKKKSDGNLQSNFTEPNEKSQQSECDFCPTEVEKSDSNLVPSVKVSTKESHLSQSKTNSLSCWPNKSRSQKRCHKDPIEVIDLSDSEVEQTYSLPEKKKQRDTSICSFSIASYFKEASFLSELELNKTVDLSDEHVELLDRSQSEINQSTSQETPVAAKRKKCKEKSKKKQSEKKSKKKSSKHTNNMQNKSSELVLISKSSSIKE